MRLVQIDISNTYKSLTEYVCPLVAFQNARHDYNCPQFCSYYLREEHLCFFLTKTYRLFVWFCSSSHFLFMLHCDWAAVVAMTTTKQILPDHLMYVAEVNVKVIPT